MSTLAQGMAFSPDGTLYAFGNHLFIVDPLSGAATRVNPADTVPVALQTIFFNSQGHLFGLGSGLYAIDTESGAKTLLAPLASSYRGAEFLAEPIFSAVPVVSARGLAIDFA